ncbi:hypothetical protein N9R04_01295 [Staphylococcus sp. SQ8-PEA]|uniref:Uncharacterized protein n=1 Tax=Staphylococcus marylandisciuri TaxID=2981529 RepID=A0ABT2QMZ6_9STAP|nr:hypothetical protein [Staphylococcus marylandisciuri]MCU5745354.1 hypothetical protein [Staphylococcus marylandisciuri]
MRKPVKMAIGIYLTVMLLGCSTYLVLILIGSLQGNDMRGAVQDADNTKNVKHISSLSSYSQSDLHLYDQLCM